MPLRQELGHGGFIAGINPRERGHSDGFTSVGCLDFASLSSFLWCDQLGSVDDWPMANSETKQQGKPACDGR